jgi:3'(2'), 5'-bisphosphate nucleotidase
MKLEPWQREFDVALGAVRDAAALAREIRKRSSGHPLAKADGSPVTVADFAVQALVADRLASAFPDDALVAEEDASVLRSSGGRSLFESVLDALGPAPPGLGSSQVLDAIDRGRGTPGERFWALDPVDGTQGFVRGDQYVVALALVLRGRVEIGLLGCPQLTDDRQQGVGSVVCAIRNRGAFRAPLAGGEFVPLRVSSCGDPSKARVLRSFEGEHIDLNTFNKIIELLGVTAPPTLMDSQAKHAVIAAGQADLLIRLPATREFCDTIWDLAAGSIIIEEAGGRVTDLRGIPLDFGIGRLLARNEGVIASNGHLHAAVLDAVRHIQACT